MTVTAMRNVNPEKIRSPIREGGFKRGATTAAAVLILTADCHAPQGGAPRGMKKGRNRGWTLMDADIPVARHRFVSIRVYPRPSAVRIFETDCHAPRGGAPRGMKKGRNR
jgi:hypothetical protein